MAAVILFAIASSTSLLFAQADNDDFVHRQRLEGTNILTDVLLLDATREPGERPDDRFNGGSVWFSWTAPSDGVLTFDVETIDPAATRPFAAVFTGNSIEEIVEFISDGPYEANARQVTLGQRLEICVGLPGVDLTSFFNPARLRLKLSGPLPNVGFSHAEQVYGDAFDLDVWTGGAPLQPGEPTAAPNIPLTTLWWRWVAPAEGVVTLQPTMGRILVSGFYQGISPEALSTPDSGTDLLGLPGFKVEQGKEYLIAASAHHGDQGRLRVQLHRTLGVAGSGDLRIILERPSDLVVKLTGFDPLDQITNLVFMDRVGIVNLTTNRAVDLVMPFFPAGYDVIQAEAHGSQGTHYFLRGLDVIVGHPDDLFPSRSTLTGTPVDVLMDTRGATGDGTFPGAAVWWLWMAPRSGYVVIDHLSGDFLNVQLTEGFDASSQKPLVGNHVVGGRGYNLSAQRAFGEVGTYRLTLFPDEIDNDSFATAAPAADLANESRVRLDRATVEVGEPDGPQGVEVPSIWYSFVPLENGVIEWGLSGTAVDPIDLNRMGSVFEGSELHALEPIHNLLGKPLFPVTAGKPYRLRLQATLAEFSLLTARFKFSPQPSNDPFAGATRIVGNHWKQTDFQLHGSTAEPGEPAVAPEWPVLHSRWWRWTASEDGLVAVRLEMTEWSFGSGLPFVAEMFHGPGLTGLSLLTPSPLQTDPLTSVYQVSKGEEYFLRVCEYVNGAFPNIQTNRFNLQLDASDLVLSITNPQPSYLISQVPTLHAVGTRLSEPGTVVLYRTSWVSGESNVLREIGSGLDLSSATAQGYPFVPTNWLPGIYDVFAVAVDPERNVQLSSPVRLHLRPDNDDFENRQLLPADRHAGLSATTLGATFEPNEPTIGAPPIDLTLWYSWQAPAAGVAEIKARRDHSVRLYLGHQLSALENVVPVGGTSYEPRFQVQASQWYQIQVGISSTIPSRFRGGIFPISVDLDSLQWLGPSTNVFTGSSPVPVRFLLTEPLDQVQSVALRVDGLIVGIREAPPFDFDWIPQTPGIHRVQGVAFLRSGLEVTNVARELRVRPRNNDFAGAERLEGRVGIIPWDFAGADLLPRVSATQKSTVWYTWRPEADGAWLIQSTNVITSAVVSEVYTGAATNQLVLVSSIGSLAGNGWMITRVKAGVIYNLKLTGLAGKTPPPLLFHVLDAPPNDRFSDSITAVGDRLRLAADTFAATAEAGEPAHSTTPATRSAWWTWVAPSSGVLRRVSSAEVSVYAGQSVDSLNRVPWVGQSKTEAWVEAGLAYHIAIDDRTGLRPETVVDLEFLGGPRNDHFEDRLPLLGRVSLFYGDLTYATRQLAEPTVDGTNFGHSVWWSWIPAHSGPAVFRNLGQEYLVPRLSVFQGTQIETLQVLASATNEVRFEVEAGRVYQLCVDTPRSDARVLALQVLVDIDPPNDLFARRVPLLGEAASVQGWNSQAKREYREPLHAGAFGGRSVWYSWQAPRSGLTELTVEGTLPVPVLAVYRGDQVGNLSAVAASVASNLVSLVFPAVEGVDYSIAVDGAFAGHGDFRIRLEMQDSPPSPSLELRLVGLDTAELRIMGAGSRPVVIEESDDLIVWRGAFRNTDSGPIRTVILPTSSLSPRSFWRAVVE